MMTKEIRENKKIRQLEKLLKMFNKTSYLKRMLSDKEIMELKKVIGVNSHSLFLVLNAELNRREKMRNKEI